MSDLSLMRLSRDAAVSRERLALDAWHKQVKVLNAEIERLGAIKAPTDNGIDEADALCTKYNVGDIDLTTLTCDLWNKAYYEGMQWAFKEAEKMGEVNLFARNRDEGRQ